MSRINHGYMTFLYLVLMFFDMGFIFSEPVGIALICVSTQIFPFYSNIVSNPGGTNFSPFFGLRGFMISAQATIDSTFLWESLILVSAL